MRTLPTNLATHVTGRVVSLCRLCVLTFADGTTTVRFTDAQSDLTISGQTYTAATAIKMSAIQARNDGSAANFTISIASSDNGLIDFGDLLAGRYDQASVSVFVVNHLDPQDERLSIFGGKVANITIDDRGSADIECEGLTALARSAIAPRYQQTCRADLGDTKCKVPILPDDVARSTAYAVGDFVRKKTGGTGWSNYSNVYYECTTAGTTSSGAVTYTTTVGNTTTDGTAVFTCRNAWLRYGVVATVVDTFTITATITEPRGVDDWFKWGVVIWRSGNSAGTQVECRGWVDSSNTLTLMMPTTGAIQVGDEFEITPGCDKRASTCRTKFNNLPNFRGEPHIPGVVSG